MRTLTSNTLTDLDFRVCDPHPASRATATQLFDIEQIVSLDENKNPIGDTSARLCPPEQYYGNFTLGKDGATVHVRNDGQNPISGRLVAL